MTGSARLVLMSVVVTFVACGQDATAPRATLNLDPLFAEQASAESLALKAVFAAGALTIMQASAGHGNCTWEPVADGYVCAVRVAPPLRLSVTFQLRDGAGTTLETYDASKVASVRTITSGTGSIQGSPVGSAAVDAHRHCILSGLLADKRLLNCDGTVKEAFGTVPILDGTLEIHELELPVTGGSNPYPLSGYVVVSNTRGVLVETVTATFDGTSLVKLSVASNLNPRNCVVDLTTQNPFC